MKEKLNEIRAKLLSTDYPQWRNLLSCVVLIALSTGAVLSWWYAYYTLPETACHEGFLLFSVLWLAVQWVVIGYLYWYRDIPAFARNALKLLILVANIWFGLFIFSLQPCIS
ncbi:hypothetical protein [Amphritea pacifica]|uniref:Uncharacterized protein n=1 Tax=Amphritea pacifica TaxID=2811233 RepID=A0ABS2WBE4_9GAMM|nr:hypothetical protein [Amphritea pacifica]MBN0988920.1 hypothetical protein [Amphritea pacifica]MBN1006868.1 hypothetical protein [Amphritea pacifica]